MGGGEVYDHLKKKLGVDTGGTSADGKFTVKEVECLLLVAGDQFFRFVRNTI
jgi:NADH:ubiquinone oxidoreductase subunit E